MNETTAAFAESAPHEIITAGYIVISIILSAIVGCTLIGNLFVIAAILIDKNLQTTANQLVLSLAVADLMVACLVMPLGAYNDINQGWRLGKGVCEFWTSADVLCCTASILNLLAIALDRYWAVTNVDYIYKRTRRRVSLMILCAWTVGAIVSLAPIFGWRDPDFARRVLDEHRCLVSQDVGYQIFATISTFYAPLVLLLALYWRIFQVARKRIRHKPGGRKSGQSGQTGETTNLMIKSGNSRTGRDRDSSEKDEQSGVCAGGVADDATTAAGVKSFAQVREKVAAERTANNESDCSGYRDGQASHCGAPRSGNNAPWLAWPPATTATKLTTANSAPSARARAREFNSTSAPTLANDKFRLDSMRAGGGIFPAGSFVAAENRLHQRTPHNERGDESSGSSSSTSDDRDNRAARAAAAAAALTTKESGANNERGAKMNEGKIHLRRAGVTGVTGNARQAKQQHLAAQDAARDQQKAGDYFLPRTGRSACNTQAEADDNKTNELAPATAQAATARPATMIELGDKLTSVSGRRREQERALETSSAGVSGDIDNDKNDDEAEDNNQLDASEPQPPLNELPTWPTMSCHAHHHSLLLVHAPNQHAQPNNRRDSSGGNNNNNSLAQLNVQLLASMTSDNLTNTTFGRDSSYSAPTSSQASEACQVCCCCGGDPGEDDGDRTQSEHQEDEFGWEQNQHHHHHHHLAGAGALRAVWHSDKRLARAGRDMPGLLDERLAAASSGLASPSALDPAVDRIRELLASQGFREPVPRKRRKLSKRWRRRRTSEPRSSSNNHWLHLASLGSSSSSPGTGTGTGSSESSLSSRSMLAAASTARLEPLQLIDGEQFQELQASPPISELAIAPVTASPGQADKLSDREKERRNAADNLTNKTSTDPPGSPLVRAPGGGGAHMAPATTTTRLVVEANHKVDCNQQRPRWCSQQRDTASIAGIRRANFLSSQPSTATGATARVAPVASLTGVTRGDGAGSLVSSGSRPTLSIRSRFRALGQLVSFVQTSRQFNSTSSAGSGSARASSSQSGDDEPRNESGVVGSSSLQEHQADDRLERANTPGSNRMGGPERPGTRQQATTTTTTTDLEGLARRAKTSGDIDRANGGPAVINSIRLPGGVSSDCTTATATSLPPSGPHGGQKVTPSGRPVGVTCPAPGKQARQSAAQQRRQNIEIKREKKAAKTLAIITGVFVCCWLPFFLNAIVMPICGPACTPSDLILSVLLWLGYLNSLLNPIIYTIFSPDFRRAFHRLLCWPDQARTGADKQRARGGCRARNSSDTPPVPSASVYHYEARARHRVAAMG